MIELNDVHPILKVQFFPEISFLIRGNDEKLASEALLDIIGHY